MELEFLKNVLSVPNPSRHCELIIELVENWCGAAGISCRKDGRGNLYLKKGGGGGYYPCVASHLDSVLPYDEAKDLLDAKAPMEVREENGRITAWIDGDQTVLGSDCKAGVAICLSIMERVSKCKCALFVDEEIGCVGSSNADESFFDDVSFIVEFDSPEYNRCAYACSGVKLFDDEFAGVLKPICAKHGVTDFRSEPFTDVKVLREKLHLCCFNTGNGGWNCHSPREYCVYGQTCRAEDLGVDLVENIPSDKRWISEPEIETPRYRPYSGTPFRFGGSWSGSFETDRVKVRLMFGDREAAKSFGELVTKRGNSKVSAEISGSDVELVGSKPGVQYFYSVYRGIVTGKGYKGWSQLPEPDRDAFETKAEPVGGKPAPSPWGGGSGSPLRKAGRRGPNGESPQDDASIMIEFRDEFQVDEFLAEFQEFDGAEDVEIEDGIKPTAKYVTGSLADVQDVWTIAFDVMHGKDYSSWDDLDQNDPTDRFWRDVEVMPRADADDDDPDAAIDVDSREVTKGDMMDWLNWLDGRK